MEMIKKIRKRKTLKVVYSFISRIWCSLVFYEPMHQDRKVNEKRKNIFNLLLSLHFKLRSYRFLHCFHNFS